MRPFAVTFKTPKTMDEALNAVKTETQRAGFQVLAIHDLSAAMAAKGINRAPLKIVEICNAKYANELLNEEITLALMLPCPIAIYQGAECVCISAMLPTSMVDVMPDVDIQGVACEVESAVRNIVESAI